MKITIMILLFMGGTPVEMSALLRWTPASASDAVHSATPEASLGGQGTEPRREVTVKDHALKVLDEKCNICHRRQNPRKVFTEANMDDLAPAIYKQVFVKKRMPRGNTIKLTADDEKALLEWIRSLGLF